MPNARRALSAFVAGVLLATACQPSRPPDVGLPPVGNVDTAPPVARRYVALKRALLVDSEAVVAHQAALCEPSRIIRVVGLAKGDTIVQWVLRNVYTTLADELAVERVLAAFGGMSFEVGGPLCEALADLVTAESRDGVAPLTISEAQRELIRKERRDRYPKAKAAPRAGRTALTDSKVARARLSRALG